jgi:hypothetical protein
VQPFNRFPLGSVALYLILTVWPYPAPSQGLREAPIPDSDSYLIPITLFGLHFLVSGESRLLMLVAIGSYLRSVISFASYAATGRMPKSTWLWWCILQTYIGMFLALLFYFIMRGTTMPLQATADQINPFTITGIAGLVGLFTQQATDKLAAFFGAVSIGSARQKRGNEVSDVER